MEEFNRQKELVLMKIEDLRQKARIMKGVDKKLRKNKLKSRL